MKPKIGIVTCGFLDNRQFVPDPYIHAVSCSGAIPYIIPYTPISETYIHYLSTFHGFLFCGGNDINPLLYGEEPLTDRGSTDLTLDRFHIEFMKTILKKEIPVLGICRGMQVMNLALGGSIYQDLSLRNCFTLNHIQNSRKRSDVSHYISFKKESMLYNFFQDNTSVNSFHHQCIKNPGSHVIVSATASDGVIEAIEHSHSRFAVGVQWHPECMYEDSSAMRMLFDTFIMNCL